MNIKIKTDSYSNFIFLSVVIVILLLIVYLSSGSRNIPIDNKITDLNQHLSFDSSDMAVIKKHLNALKKHKSKMEKALETKGSRFVFGVKDCEEIEKTAFACGNLLLKMGGQSSSKINISRIKAADDIAWQLAVETAKLKSFIWNGRKNRRKIYNQLSKVEANSRKLEVHLNALFRQQNN